LNLHALYESEQYENKKAFYQRQKTFKVKVQMIPRNIGYGQIICEYYFIIIRNGEKLELSADDSPSLVSFDGKS